MRKSILFMVHLPPPVHGAAMRNKSLLESKLLNNEYNIVPLPLKFTDNMKDLGKFSVLKIWLMISHSFKLISIFSTKKINLVYFTMSPSGGAFYRDILFIFIIRLFRKKALLHFRMKGIKRTSQTPIGKILVKYAFNKSDVICLSKHHVEDMAGLTNNQPFIVPNGIKVETAYLHLADEYVHAHHDMIKILFLSNLSRKKGIPELINALHLLDEKGYILHTNIVGNEWDLSFEEVEKLIASAGLAGKVTIEGPKFGEEKFNFIALTDIFVFPTYFELFPGVILEAMQFGKAIVSTFEGSIPEIIDNGVNGVLVQQQNPVHLADAIASFIDHPEKRRRMADLAKEKFFNQYTLEIFERNMHQVFEKVLNN
ncbi:MAG TPA: glycosyltransferase family 4 protein [Flavitalea sp.]|nr:glycosyltransferase family 4 protein [Flavitalea sp.]